MVKLVQLTEDDLDFLLEVRNHDSTRYFLENDSIFDINQCKKWFKTISSPWYIIKYGNELVGYFRTNGLEVGCDIHPKFRRMGFARKAYIEFLKDKDYASLWVFEDNFAKKLYEELGFINDGEYKFVRDRKYIKMVLLKK
jgi:hypothetical protein